MSDSWGPTEVTTTDTKPRCRDCARMLALLVTRPWVIMCPRCKTTNSGLLPGQAAPEALEAFIPMDTPSRRDRRSQGNPRPNPSRLQHPSVRQVP